LPVDSQPPPPSLPLPYDNTNFDLPSSAGALPGAAGVLPADIKPPAPSPPQKLTFTVIIPSGEFDFNDSDFDS
jgi:hypothetical protein